MSTSAPSALVTGATRGIGHGIATHLATQGWQLTLAARDGERLARVQQEVQRLGSRAEVVPADMADEAALSEVAAHHEQTYGVLNALVLAAGVGTAGPIEDYPVRRFDKQFAVNTRAPFLLLSRALPMLREAARRDPARGGRVVALTSLESVHPERGLAAYGASKAALLSLVQSVNIEEGERGVAASAISPGFVDTDMSAWVTDRIPPESMITVDDVVKVVDLVLSVSRTAVLPHIVINRAGSDPHHA